MPYSVEERRINNSKQNAVHKVHAKPTVNSLSEGEEVVYQGRNEPLARYRKEGGKLWVSYMTSDGNIYVPKNLDVDGIIFSSGEEVVQADSLIPTKAGGTGVTVDTTWLNTNVVATASGVLGYDGSAVAPSLPSISGTLTPAKGGTGQDLSGSTGAISVSSGTVAAGTLAISNGGTNAGDSNGWLNSRVTINNDGTLNYDATAAAAPNLVNIAGTLTSAKGGTGQDLSSSTGLVTVSSGTVAADATPAVNLTDSTNVPLDQIKSGTTLAVAKGGTGDTDSDTWLNTRVVMTANGVLGYDASAVACTMNTLADANNVRARVTGSLDSSNGLKTGIAIGDALKKFVIYNGSNKNTLAANTDDATPATDLYWRQTDTTYVKKIEFNYIHDTDIQSLVLYCNLYVPSGLGTAYARLVLYEIVSGGTSPLAASTTIINDGGAVAEISSGNAAYTPVFTGKCDVSGLNTSPDDEILYRAAVEMKSSASGVTAYMTGVAVIGWGA